MRIPRGNGADGLISLLRRYGYESTRQTGSHIRITTTLNGEHHVTIPRHKPS
jgi:predicted RNA binding protein YcfA (HicA-like mRNA interferase family)